MLENNKIMSSETYVVLASEHKTVLPGGDLPSNQILTK